MVMRHTFSEAQLPQETGVGGGDWGRVMDKTTSLLIFLCHPVFYVDFSSKNISQLL